MNATTPKKPLTPFDPKGLGTEDISLLTEIDESLRAEKLAKVWKDFGAIIVTASVLVVLSTVGFVLWKNYMVSKNQEITAQLVQAQDLERQGKYSDAADIYVRVTQSDSKKSALAALRASDALLGAGQQEKALKLLSDVKQTDSENAFESFAKLKRGSVAANGSAHDDKALQESAAPSQTFSFTARELLALRLLESGKEKEARDIFSAIQLDPLAPFSMKQRASNILHTLDTKNATGAAQNATTDAP